ncbi:phosphotransferase family protein [Paenibacillus sp. CAU 1782]
MTEEWKQQLGQKIAEGGCSEVHAWGSGDQIVKIAKPNTGFDAMEKEFANNKLAWENGLPVTRPFQLLKVEDRPAIVFERIYGETVMERFLKELSKGLPFSDSPIIEEDVRLTARALADIHRKPHDGSLPSQRESMKYAILGAGYLTKDETEKITDFLDELPVKNAICHGDPNPKNIMVREDGTYAVLDWMNASAGNPEADLAEYIIMVRYAILPPTLPPSALDHFDTLREPMIHAFLDEYRKETGITREEAELWVLPSLARKLCADGITEAEKVLLIKDIRESLERQAVL